MVLPVVQEIRLSCSQKGDSAENTQPGSHLGEMRMEAEECESSPCVPEALKLFRAGAPCLSADLSVCLSVCPWRLYSGRSWFSLVGRLGFSVIFILCVASFPAEKLFFSFLIFKKNHSQNKTLTGKSKTAALTLFL